MQGSKPGKLQYQKFYTDENEVTDIKSATKRNDPRDKINTQRNPRRRNWEGGIQHTRGVLSVRDVHLTHVGSGAGAESGAVQKLVLQEARFVVGHHRK